MMTVTAPLYFLVVTYTGIQFFLHMKEHILRGVILSVKVPNIQQSRCELLQLTAGDAN
jgi:hypothetical protein